MKNKVKRYASKCLFLLMFMLLFLIVGCQSAKPQVEDDQEFDSLFRTEKTTDNEQSTEQNTEQSTQSDPAIDTEDVNSVRFAEVLGDVQFVKGDDTLWFQAVPGMQLNLNDTLATKVASEADLDVDQDKHVLVGEEVRLVVAKLLKEVGKSKATSLKMDTGTIYVRIQRKLDQDETFEVITPTCIMGVRGTHFVVEVLGGDTTISVIEGEVEGQLLVPMNSDSNQPTDQSGIQQKNMPKFTVKTNQRLTIPLGARTEKQWIRSKLTPEKLPVFVLTKIEKNPENLPSIYRKSLIQAIEEAHEIASTEGATLGALRFKISGTRYVDPLTGHVYARIDQTMTFKEAKEWCEARGGHLVSITGSEEQAIVEGLIAQGQKTFYLTGLYQNTGAKEPAQGFICEWEAIAEVRIIEAADETATQRGEIASTTTKSIATATVQVTRSTEATTTAQVSKTTETTTTAQVTKPTETTTTAQVIKPIEYTLVSEVTKSLIQPVTTAAATTSTTSLELINWETATAEQYPFNARLMTYDLFLRQNIGNGIESLIKTIGVSVKTKTETQVQWIYTAGVRQLSVGTVNGKIVSSLQKNLTSSLCSQDFEVLAFRRRVYGLKSLEEVQQVMGTKGVIESKIQSDTGDISTTWIWSDAKGYIFAVTVNEAQNTFASSFRNLK